MDKSNEENQFTGSKQRQQQLRRREGGKTYTTKVQIISNDLVEMRGLKTGDRHGYIFILNTSFNQEND